MNELELILPTKEYKTQLEDYLQEFINNNEYEIIGDSNLCKIKNINKWLEEVKLNHQPYTWQLENLIIK